MPVRGTTQIRRSNLRSLPVRDNTTIMIVLSDTAFPRQAQPGVISAENPLKSTGMKYAGMNSTGISGNIIFQSVRFTAQRPLSILSLRELTATAPSLRFGKNVLLLVNAFSIFNFNYDNTACIRFQVILMKNCFDVWCVQ